MCINTSNRRPRRSKRSQAVVAASPSPPRRSIELQTIPETTTIEDEDQTQAKKAVSFHNVVQVRPVLHLNEYTEEERIQCWFSRTDRENTKQDIKATLKLVQESSENVDGVCTRGLEKFMDGGKICERRKASTRDVLIEQDSQIARAHRRAQAKKSRSVELVYDFAKFRSAYKPHSKAARTIAHTKGKIDEMTVKACQSDSVTTAKQRKQKSFAEQKSNWLSISVR